MLGTGLVPSSTLGTEALAFSKCCILEWKCFDGGAEWPSAGPSPQVGGQRERATDLLVSRYSLIMPGTTPDPGAAPVHPRPLYTGTGEKSQRLDT